MKRKSMIVNYCEIIKIDLLEARDYVECIKCTSTFLFAKRTSIFERFMKIVKIIKIIKIYFHTIFSIYGGGRSGEWKQKKTRTYHIGIYRYDILARIAKQPGRQAGR